MSFNINSRKVAEVTRLHLVDFETGEKMYADEAKTEKLEIEVYGKASVQYKNALGALSRKNLVRRGKPQSFETNVEDNTEILVAISKAAHNFDDDGQAIDNPAAFRKLYSNPNLFWIKDQVQEVLEDTAAFLQK